MSGSPASENSIPSPPPEAPPAGPRQLPRRWRRNWGEQDRRLLEGPRSRWAEFKSLLHIVWEFLAGFRELHFIGPCVTVFGSARFPPGHPYYELGRQVGAEIARLGFNVMTGGGPGIMEAANRGAQEAGGHSIGCNIILPKEQSPNNYIDRLISFHYFFIRKVMLVKYSQAFVILPGGYGTLDEAFEAATLVQTGKMHEFPIIFMGVKYWHPLFDFIRNGMAQAKTIDPDDIERFLLTDSIDELRAGLEQTPFKLFAGKPLPERRWWLGE
ncbi:MAG: TIGR00730 family Rossman fold protein [Planctomycetaceae bacterium]|jgi:uncharacterized protein (TIGR00730 family)